MHRTRFHSKEERLKSLEHWPPGFEHNFNLEEFADAGFYCEQYGDDPEILRCEFCKAAVGNWMANDNPWEEHIWSTTKPCKYILRYKGEEFVRAIRDKVEEADTVQTGHFAMYCVIGFEETASSSEHNAGDNRIITAQNVSSISDMVNLQSRMATFDAPTCQSDVIICKKTELAESGFYFEGMGPHRDSVRCFSCHCAMYNILDGDEIWAEHARNSNCNHVIKMKGLKFVLAVRRTTSTVTNDKEMEKVEDVGHREGLNDQRGSFNKKKEEVNETNSCSELNEMHLMLAEKKSVIEKPRVQPKEIAQTLVNGERKRKCTRSIQCKQQQEEMLQAIDTGQLEIPTEGRLIAPLKLTKMTDTDIRGSGRDLERDKTGYLCCRGAERRGQGKEPCPKCGKNVHIGRK